MIAVLAGGVGAARFLRGVVRAVPPEEVTVISNTGDDARIYGVHVSPDVDIVTYTLAGIVDEDAGFGIAGDTHHVIEELAACGVEPWFRLGDRDLGLCLARTVRLDRGEPLSAITASLARRLGVPSRILPMTDDRVETRILVADESGATADLHFQEYWVARRAAGRVLEVRLDGAARAAPAPGVLDALASAETVLVAPSNPVVSIGTILAVPGVRAALAATGAPVVGVSPIVGGRVVRGMADRLMPAAGVEVSCAGVATLYRDFLDGLVVDTADAALAPAIRALGVEPEVAPTVMRGPEDSAALAKTALALAERVRRR